MSFKKVIRERVDEVERYVDNNLMIEDLIRDRELGEVNGKVLSCPFHDDEIPSMFVDVSTNKWKCHSCGRGGRYIKLYYYILTIVEGKNYSYYDVLDEMLRDYTDMRFRLGFSSIYEDTSYSLSITNIKLKETKKPKVIKISTVRNTALNLKKLNDVNTIMNFITDCEAGREDYFINTKYSNTNIVEDKIDDIMDILKDKYSS